MIPTSFLFRDMYNDQWGDPDDPNGVEPRPSQSRWGAFLTRLHRPNAWSFTLTSKPHHRRPDRGL